jgi:site-specific recombinase XerD
MTSLRRRMREDMQVRSLSPQTQATYVQQVSLFARHFNRSPELLGPEEIRSYQVYLTNVRKLAPSSINIAISALRFLYRITLHKDWSLTEVIPTPKKPKKLPIVPSPEEVLQPFICWNRAPTCAQSSCCWAIAAWLPQGPICESPTQRCAPPRARSICFPKRSVLS